MRCTLQLLSIGGALGFQGKVDEAPQVALAPEGANDVKKSLDNYVKSSFLAKNVYDLDGERAKLRAPTKGSPLLKCRSGTFGSMSGPRTIFGGSQKWFIEDWGSFEGWDVIEDRTARPKFEGHDRKFLEFQATGLSKHSPPKFLHVPADGLEVNAPVDQQSTASFTSPDVFYVFEPSVLGTPTLPDANTAVRVYEKDREVYGMGEQADEKKEEQEMVSDLSFTMTGQIRKIVRKKSWKDAGVDWDYSENVQKGSLQKCRFLDQHGYKRLIRGVVEKEEENKRSY